MKLIVKTKNIRSIIRAGALGLLLIGLKAETAKAQLHPLGAIYYQNPYLINPALAGKEEGFYANAAVRRQWSNMPGAPSTQALSFEYGSGKKSGVGINLYNDEAGLQKRTRVRGTYAYQLPLDADGQRLSFGVSLGYSDDRLMQERLSSNVDGSDRSIAGYQDRDTYFDGDFGAAYQGKKLGLELAVPNLKSFFKKDQAEGNLADESKLYTAASYKMFFADALDGMTLEPKVAYRQIKGFEDIVDFGANMSLAENKVNVMAVYHSTRSTTIGMGVKYQKYLVISGIFTSGTAAIRDYTNGNFELNLRVSLGEVFKGKK
ncbi:PorP/SprF family type IX secretion system membrane protein [Desertivirga arenae]|uniref:PorP/SprF family type IX secretion system membrane protein n=1 Tax=Desertivirga arenae TaxID=2810309 RepID=UPI001A96B901|nr:type IX secretion system membrane protein PorP/SprF [Pedobacter sp. SYSU D00823]